MRLTLVFILLCFSVNAQLAFPSCEGAGCDTTSGARGGSVYHVTNLNNSGAGSFRDALSADDRTVVFGVAGVIVLTSPLTLNNRDNITIAGQTAPDGGITIDGARFARINCDNWIIRYIRFKNYTSGDDSFVSKENITNDQIDHVSFAYSGDEIASWYSTASSTTVDNVNIQYCFFNEASSHTGTIIGGLQGSSITVGDISVHHNIYRNVDHRHPNIAGDNTSNFAIINNVVWYHKDRLTRSNGDYHLNHQGNYYDFGPQPYQNNRLNQHAYTSAGDPEIFTDGNVYVAANTGSPINNTISAINADNDLGWTYFLDGGGFTEDDDLDPANFVSTVHDFSWVSPITVQTAAAAFASLKTDIGNSKRLLADGTTASNYDTQDAAWLAEIVADNTSSYMTSGFDPSSITGGTAYTDTDSDGIPDTYETAQGWSTSVANNNTVDGSGYTQLELFLNEIDDAAVVSATAIVWNDDAQTITTAQSLNLAVTFTPTNTTDKGVTYSSTNTSVINNSGTTIGAGTCTLTVTSDDGSFTDAMAVTVNALAAGQNININRLRIGGKRAKIKVN